MAKVTNQEIEAPDVSKAYLVLDRIEHDGVAYEPGVTIDLIKKFAEPLLKVGVIKLSTDL